MVGKKKITNVKDMRDVKKTVIVIDMMDIENISKADVVYVQKT